MPRIAAGQRTGVELEKGLVNLLQLGIDVKTTKPICKPYHAPTELATLQSFPLGLSPDLHSDACEALKPVNGSTVLDQMGTPAAQ